MSSHPQIRYSELVKGDNIIDQVFSDYVDLWMQRMFDSQGPLGLLDTTDAERWSIEVGSWHRVEEVEVKVWECPECGQPHEEAEEVCCYGEDDVALPMGETTRVAWVLVNENTNDSIDASTDYAWRDIEPWRDVEHGEEKVYAWFDEAEAQSAAEWADSAYESEHGHELRHGFPWANNHFYVVDGINTDLLKAAGFVVAEYQSPDGDSYTLCGIDGGGYSFKGQHFAKLVGLWSELRDADVPTQQGDRVVSFDEREDLVKLAEELAKPAGDA